MKMIEKLLVSEDGHEIFTIINTPNERPKGCVIFCHGITVDKDENGKFIRQAEELTKEGFEVIRFDFKGHGQSKIPSEQMTIFGELKDLEQVVQFSLGRNDNLGLLAASFGAGASLLFIKDNPTLFKSIVLWNPVLDYDKTFVNTNLPWGKSFFNKNGYKELDKDGYITMPGKEFRLSKKLIDEFNSIKPFELIDKIKCPTLTIHGTEDTKVPFDVSEKFGVPNHLSEFLSVESDHGFGDKQEFVYNYTKKWFKKTLI